MNTQLNNWYRAHAQIRDFYKELLDDNQVAQITVTNCSEQEREITLWGTNKCAPIANPLYRIELIKREVAIGQNSIEVVYNPVNDLFYVTNYSNNTITIVNDQAVVVHTVALSSNPTTPVGPTSIVVNINPNSTEYGFVAVIAIRSKELIIVDSSFAVSRKIAITNAPIDLVYNPFSDAYFLIESLTDKVLKITTSNDQVVDFLTIAGVKTLGVNTDNGDLYVHNRVNNFVEIYNTSGIKRGWFDRATVNENKVSFYYHSVNQKMYIAYDTLNSIIITDGGTLNIETSQNVGVAPIDIEYNPIDNYIYVANQADQTFTCIDENFQIVDTISLVNFDQSFAISSKNGYIALNNSTLEQLLIVSMENRLLVKVTDDYEQIREDFKYNPMLIKHMKVVASTDARINTLQIIESSISGKETCESISLRSYHSPQGFGNVSEVFEMDGYIVDGRVCWRFKINPNQQVTFLIYYEQLEMYDFLPEKSRVSTGVQMGKGMPQAWKK